jgi:hypothetical protein
VLLMLQDAVAGAAGADTAHRSVAMDSCGCCALPRLMVHCCLHMPQHRVHWHGAAGCLLLVADCMCRP